MAPIDPGDLLNLLVAQLAAPGTPDGSNLKGAGLGDRAFLTLWPDDLLLRNAKAKQFVAVRPNRFPVWQTVVQGAGSVTAGYMGQKTMTGFNTVVSLLCFQQNNADPENLSKQAVTEEARGMIALCMKVITAVQFWNPQKGSSGLYYLREPARMTDGGFGLDTRGQKDSFWSRASIDVEVKFTAAFPA